MLDIDDVGQLLVGEPQDAERAHHGRMRAGFGTLVLILVVQS